ncbi:MAG: transglycosylase SLT domain-containing protein [Oleibacter sp.]|nr:transglycosylase SLT domain-containing protein [Thalassolituus sp.]
MPRLMHTRCALFIGLSSIGLATTTFAANEITTVDTPINTPIDTIFEPLASESAATKAAENKRFAAALTAARNGNWSAVPDNLDSHVLAPYIEYHRLRSSLPQLSMSQFLEFEKKYSETPLPNWLRSSALRAYGRAQKWDAFLAMSPALPYSVENKCYFYRAKLKTDKELAFSGGKTLWLHGASRPDACDPLFDAMMAENQLDDDLIWQRMELALASGNTNIVLFLERKLEQESWKKSLSYLETIIKKPTVIAGLPELSVSEQTRTPRFAYSAMMYLANENTLEAARLWPQYQQKFNFSLSQIENIEDVLLRYIYLLPEDQLRDTIHPILERRENAKDFEFVLRNAIKESDWDAILKWTAKVGGTDALDSYNQYWRARALENKERFDEAQEAYKVASEQRNFYGFMAAEKLGQPYAFNKDTRLISAESLTEVGESPAIQRIKALMAIDENSLALSEWYFIMQKYPEKVQVLAEYARVNDWYNLSINATIQGKLWDFVPHRFPLAFQDQFNRWAEKRNVDPLLLMAIARRESAFNRNAMSHVGARGLMQVMPGTARLIAKQLDVEYRGPEQLFDQDYNIKLASHYVQTLSEKFNGNLIAVLAGYNAGPMRVDRWIQTKYDSYDQFIESIPFRETREYVKAVLTYRVILEHENGGQRLALLDPTERSFPEYYSQN